MAFGMTTLIETRNYEVIKYRTGTGLVDRPTGNTVYLQPGDDEWALLGPLEQLEEDHGSLSAAMYLVDLIVEPYFTRG